MTGLVKFILVLGAAQMVTQSSMAAAQKNTNSSLSNPRFECTMTFRQESDTQDLISATRKANPVVVPQAKGSGAQNIFLRDIADVASWTLSEGSKLPSPLDGHRLEISVSQPEGDSVQAVLSLTMLTPRGRATASSASNLRAGAKIEVTTETGHEDWVEAIDVSCELLR